ncbi:response regulator [Lichenihabitans sp. PAMC28606]|uniref:response regulator n=1 Tax=Lichenihabitans sp. PAMC28606 TaxID=2880932 RepID=UPI001D0BB645|nr:response regulator [Lichenihabitans sp. PAMC28606]UDL93281.1 response regulator [Lichenihabitans sp. PAMC28606]
MTKSERLDVNLETPDRINILLVDDQPAKLLSYEVILAELGETLIKANSAREALEKLLKNEVAVILIDVCMPELDGFELATMVREHPRFQKTAIIFVSAIQVTDLDRLRGYEAGAVDYVPVPVVPEVLRAKVKIFAELFRKTRDLERLNAELERRVDERTAALEASTASLRESEHRRDLALAAGRMGSWSWDLATGTHQWDEGQYRIFGVDPKTFAPTVDSVMALVHPDDLDLMRRGAAHAIKHRAAYDIEFRILRPVDGATCWCITGAAPSFDQEGRVVRLSGVTFDITQRKLAEDALKHLNEDLEHRIEERTREREIALAQLFEAQKIDTIGQLTGGVAHDFNNLLMAVIGSLELLKKRLPAEDARAHRLVDNAMKGADRGAALTQRLLAFARRQDLEPQDVDAGALIGGIEDFLKRAVGPSVVFSRDVPADLAIVRVDANQLELALLNLCVNARDAMPQGGSIAIVARNESVRAVRDPLQPNLAPGPYVSIKVTDTGSGMDEATLAKASEPFFTTKGPGKGTGLGLSMVHGLAAQSGGALQMSSAVGKGTTVALWLPQAEIREVADDRSFAAMQQRLEVPNEAERLLTVLVVDDDTLVSAGTTAMLEDLGHAVIEVDSAAHALAVLNDPHERIDLVVTDHAMPGMTGLELARHLQTSHPDLPVILATGYAELLQEEWEGARLPRLAKPFRQNELLAAIAHVTGPTATEDRSVTTSRRRDSAVLSI